LFSGVGHPTVIGIHALHQGNGLFRRKIQDAIWSATIAKVRSDGNEIYIKNQFDDAFSDILKALGLEDIPAYGMKEKRREAYLHTKK